MRWTSSASGTAIRAASQGPNQGWASSMLHAIMQAVVRVAWRAAVSVVATRLQDARRVVAQLRRDAGGQVEPAQQPGADVVVERVGQRDRAAERGGGRARRAAARPRWARLPIAASMRCGRARQRPFDVGRREAVAPQHQHRLDGAQLRQQLVAVRLQVLERLERRAHRARLGQRALRGLHQRRQAVEGLAPREPPFELGAGVDGAAAGPGPAPAARARLRRRACARTSAGNLAALPRRQHVAEGPGQRRRRSACRRCARPARRSGSCRRSACAPAPGRARSPPPR